MSTSIQFDEIESLVANKLVKGTVVQVTFRCEATGLEVDASAPIQRSSGVAATAERSAKSNFITSLQRTVNKLVREVFGSGAASRIASDVTRSAASGAKSQVQYSTGEVKAAVVAAFVTVQDKFEKSDAGAWSGRTASTAESAAA